MIAIIDYGRGNLFSIARALDHIGAGHVLAETPESIAAAGGLILPGVGAFHDAMAALQRSALIAPLRAAARRGTPLLGICLGMQLLFSRSDEFGDHGGLDLIPGRVRRLPPPNAGPEAIRIPNVGWRHIRIERPDPLLADAVYYFVHSFAPAPDDQAHITATLPVNGAEIAVAVRRDNLVGVQFHPEKSGPEGLALLGRFAASVARRRDAA